MELYFDNAAAMKPDPALTAYLAQIVPASFCNQEALASPGAKLMAQAEQEILDSLCGDAAGEYRVWFVNTGTDAVRASFDAMGMILAEKRKNTGKIALSGGEHASVKKAAEDSGLTEQIFTCDRDGFITENDYAAAVTPDCRIAAVHFVQPESGIVQDLLPLRRVLEERAPDAMLFADAIQGAGKIPFDFKKIKPDFFTVSGQKLGVLNGGAVLCRKAHFRILQKLRTSEHKYGRLNPFFALTLAECLKNWKAHRTERATAAQQLKEQFFRELNLKIKDRFTKTVSSRETSPFIAHLLLKDCYQGAIIVRALSSLGISIASGSACEAETGEPSAALRWMGVTRKQAFAALRISFSPQNDPEGVSRLTDAIAHALDTY